MSDGHAEFVKFVEKNLGDVASIPIVSKKLASYWFVWLHAKTDSFEFILNELSHLEPYSYETENGTVKFHVDRTRQYQLIYEEAKKFYMIKNLRYNTCMKQNWFNTLNEALESEGLMETWDCFWSPIGYGETRVYHTENERVSIYRETDGRYERPVHYKISKRK